MNARVGIRRYGTGPKKVVGLHGWFGGDQTFDRLNESLDPEEYSCAWIVHRGMGASRGVEGTYSIAEMAEDAVATGKGLGWSHFSVVGHSMGGKAALVAAATAPDHVDRVVALAPVPAAPTQFPPQMRRRFEKVPERLASREAVIRSSLGGVAPEYWVRALADSSTATTPPAVSRAYFNSWADDDIRDLVRGCTVPVLGVVGANDPSLTASDLGAEYRELLEVWEVVEVSEAGHYVLDEAPLRVGALCEAHLRGTTPEPQ